MLPCVVVTDYMNITLCGEIHYGYVIRTVRPVYNIINFLKKNSHNSYPTSHLCMQI